MEPQAKEPRYSFPYEDLGDDVYRAKWTDIRDAAREAEPILPQDMTPGMRHTCLEVLGVVTWHLSDAVVEQEGEETYILWRAQDPNETSWADEGRNAPPDSQEIADTLEEKLNRPYQGKRGPG